MSTNIARCFLAVIILFSSALQGSSALSNGELTAQHSEESMRQTKAAEMLRYMNATADPCDDFYEFVCGNYANYHETNTSTSGLDALEEAMNAKLQQELEVDNPADTDYDRKVKVFYRSCLAAPAMLSVNKLKDVIGEFGQMPVLEGDNWQESDFDWSRTVPEIFHKTGKSIIFGLVTYRDFENKSLNLLYFGETQLVLKDRAFYVDETIPGEREKLKANVAKDLQQFMSVEEELAKQTAREIVDFEIDLARSMHDKKAINSGGFEFLAIDELEIQFLLICNFTNFISVAMDFAPKTVLVDVSYLTNALEVLKKTPPKVVANYIFYTYVRNYIFQLKDAINTLEKYCTETTKELFYKNLVNLAYRRYFGEQSKETVLSMWHNIRTTLKDVLHSRRLNWIANETLQLAEEKLNAMHLDILTYEQDNFTREFEDLRLDSQDYVHNMQAILGLRAQQFRSKFNETPESFLSTYFLPFYFVWENTIKLPITVLQPYYTASSVFPDAYNFALLGAFIAHETLHGFDRFGQWYDANCSLQLWWDSQSLAEFEVRSNCIRDQYKSYTFGGRRLDLEEQSENIADNGAVRLAYEAYRQHYEKKEKDAEGSFPGLSYNHKQLFFISYGQGLCAATNPDYMTAHVAGDIHVPEKFRVIGPLSNFEEFSEVFNCPRGSGMNPEHKCEIY